MSTKTLRKRIALVAVSALGLGLMSVAPAQASNSFSSNITLSTPSLTVVGATGSSANAGWFYADLTTTDTTTATAPAPAQLRADESITAWISAFPVGFDTTKVSLTAGALSGNGNAMNSTLAAVGNAQAATITSTGAFQIPNAAATYVSGNWSHSTTEADNNEKNRYWFAVYPTDTSPLDKGEFTITVRLNNNSSVGRGTVDRTIKVKFVSNIADAGAVLSAVTQTGNITSNRAYGFTATTSTRVTLSDANGGRVVRATAATGGIDPANWAPVLTANFVSSTGVLGESLNINDDGTSGRDFAAASATGFTDIAASATVVQRPVSEQLNARSNGVYGVYDNQIATAASATNTIRVQLQGTGLTASSSAVTVVLDNDLAHTGAAVTLTAAGTSAADKLQRFVNSTTGAISYTVPASTTTVTVDIATAGAVVTGQSGKAYTSTITWGGNFATASVTPATTTALTSYVGVDGVVSRTLTNSNPVAGAIATISLAGFVSGGAATVTITWAAPAPASVLVLDPAPGVFSALKASTVFTFGVYDQFGNGMAGQQVQPRVSGTTGNNPLGTTNYAVVTTGATGTGTFTLTDALAANLGTDSVTFTTITGGIASSPYVVNYRTTLPVIGIMSEFYDERFIADASLSASTVATAVPSTGIATAKTLVLARDLSASLTTPLFADTTANDDMIQVRVRGLTAAGAVATGAPVTLTAGAGGHVVGANGLPATSRVVAIDANGDAYFRILATATGVITWTVTSGTLTDTIRMTVATAAAGTARTVALSGATTGAANGSGIPMTVTVKDRYGNNVTGSVLTVTASGVGAFMGGSTSQSFTTDATGSFTFLATSFASAGGTATFTARATNAVDADSRAGFVTLSAGAAPIAVDSTLAAGAASTSVVVTFTAGVSATDAAIAALKAQLDAAAVKAAADKASSDAAIAAAQAAAVEAATAAADAAAEATDAANAATDAANASAEAGDAATAAAQDAADAVAALSTQVSEMIDTLKKQITALTNLVIKIQKKVRA